MLQEVKFKDAKKWPQENELTPKGGDDSEMDQ